MRLKITENDLRNLKRILVEFSKPKTDEEIFYSLCFCLMAPQTTFKANTKVINNLKEIDFYRQNYSLKNKSFLELIKPARFYNNKARYLIEAKKKFPEIIEKIDQWIKIYQRDDLMSIGVRDWLVINVKGLGMKASSHFLRNLGDINLAIIDTHIIKFLSKYNVYVIGSISSKGQYIEAEYLFQQIAKENKLTTAELDAYVWKTYSGTSWEDFKF